MLPSILTVLVWCFVLTGRVQGSWTAVDMSCVLASSSQADDERSVTQKTVARRGLVVGPVKVEVKSACSTSFCATLRIVLPEQHKTVPRGEKGGEQRQSILQSFLLVLEQQKA